MFPDTTQISYFWSKGLTWSDFVSTLLLKTGQIDKTATLGGNVNGWSQVCLAIGFATSIPDIKSDLYNLRLQDKIWVVGHSLVTPGGSCSYCDKVRADFHVSDSSLYHNDPPRTLTRCCIRTVLSFFQSCIHP